jgi:pimeloyl-[acyl-carrier protein] methyl ester esterase
VTGHDAIVEVPGARLRYRTRGRGPAVVLLHGWALDLDVWERQFTALTDAFQVIACDRRGFGRSTGVPSLREDVMDLERLLVILGIEHAAIVGMSQGARVALHWAMRFPDRTCCLVLDGPPADIVGTLPAQAPPEIPVAQYGELARTQGLDAFRMRWLDHPLMRLFVADPEAQALLERITRRYPGRDLLAEGGTESLDDCDLRTVQTAALVVNGEHDTARRTAGLALARALPHAEQRVIPAAGHLANLDNPAAYNATLRQFLERNCRQTARIVSR